MISTDIALKSTPLRHLLSGIGPLGVELRPNTQALIEQGLRVQSLLDLVADDLELADALDVDSPELLAEAEAINSRLAAVFSPTGAIEQERMALTAPFNDIVKVINRGYNLPREFGFLIKAKLDAKILAYNARERRKAQEAAAEEQRRRQVEAEAAAAAEQAAQEEAKRLLVTAATMEGDAAQALIAEASVVADAGRAASAQAALELHTGVHVNPAAKAKGVRETWTAEEVTLDSLILAAAEGIKRGDRSLAALLMLDQSAANAKAKAERTAFNVPGLRACCKEGITTRKAAL